VRVLVCGGRNYADSSFVSYVLDAVHAKKSITLIIHGCASGADTFAEKWAAQTPNCTAYGVPTDWKKHGDKAAAVRNRLMLEHGKPDLVLAFETGEGSRGLVNTASATGLKVIFAEQLRHHFEPLTVAQRIKQETVAQSRAKEADKWAPKSTGGRFAPLCDCKVLPWEDCEHTR
jgi:hypothetical protein